MTPEDVRRVHRPVPRECGCGGWMCCEDKLLWPCLVEVQLRESGVPPVTISDYPDYAEA